MALSPPRGASMSAKPKAVGHVGPTYAMSATWGRKDVGHVGPTYGHGAWLP